METGKNDATQKQQQPGEEKLKEPQGDLNQSGSSKLSIVKPAEDAVEQSKESSHSDQRGKDLAAKPLRALVEKEKLEQEIKEIRSSMKRIKSSKLIQSSSRTKKRITEDTIYRFTTAGKRQAAKDYILSLQLADRVSECGRELAKMELSEFINVSGKLQIELRIRNIVDVQRQSSEESKSQEDSVTQETEVKIEELTPEEQRMVSKKSRTIYLPKLLSKESQANQSEEVISISKQQETIKKDTKEEGEGAAKSGQNAEKASLVEASPQAQDILNLDSSSEINVTNEQLSRPEKEEKSLSEQRQVSISSSRQDQSKQAAKEAKNATEGVAKDGSEPDLALSKLVSDHLYPRIPARTIQQTQNQHSQTNYNGHTFPSYLSQHQYPAFQDQAQMYPLHLPYFRNIQSTFPPVDFFSTSSIGYPIYAFNRPQQPHSLNTTKIPYTSPYQSIDETSSQQSSVVNNVIVIDSSNNLERIQQPEIAPNQIHERSQTQTLTQTAVSVSNQPREIFDNGSNHRLSQIIEPIENSMRKISITENQSDHQQPQNKSKSPSQVTNNLLPTETNDLQDKHNKKQTHSQTNYNPNRNKFKRKNSCSNKQTYEEPQQRPRKLRSQQTEEDKHIQSKKKEIVARLSYIKSTLPSFLEAYQKQDIASMQRSQANFKKLNQIQSIDPKVNEITSLCANLSMACEQPDPLPPDPSITAHMNGTSRLFRFQPHFNDRPHPAILFMKKRQEPQPTSIFQLKPRSSSLKKTQEEELVENKKKRRGIVRIHQ